jgi:ribosomal protein S18 acetylase RimI-like enzyme
MPDIRHESAAQFTLAELADLFTASFEGYLVPVAAPIGAFAARIRSEQIDLHLSRVVRVDGAAAGLCLLAQRGVRVRVAGMGIAAAWRRQGLGRALLAASVAAAKSAGGRRLLLEVFAANPAAVALYESFGFRRQRHLVGFARSAFGARFGASSAADYRIADLETLAAAMAAEPELAWPWQLSPHTLVAAASDSLQVHALGRDAYACLNAANPQRLSLRVLYVSPAARRQGRARRLLEAIQTAYQAASWEIPPLVPEEFSPEALVSLGFKRTPLYQLEMELR